MIIKLKNLSITDAITAESVLDSTMKRDIGDGKGWKVIP